MNRENVIIYLNSTGDKAIDQNAAKIAEDFCKRRGYKVLSCVGEDTKFEGISFPMKYMLVGLAAEEKIDTVITIGSFMLGDTDKILDLIDSLETYSVYVETVAEDMDDYYDLLLNSCEAENVNPNAEEFVSSLATLFGNCSK